MKHFEKAFTIVMLIVTILSVSISAQAASPATNSNAVNIRKAAKTSATLVGQVAKGTTLQVLGETNGTTLNGSIIWLKVKVLKCAAGRKNNIDGKTGFVHSSFVSNYTTGTSHPQTQDEAFGASGYLQKGSSGNCVYNVQRALYHALLLSDRECDGAFGSDTEQAVINYQVRKINECKLGEDGADGVVGPLTKKLLWDDYGDYLKHDGRK